MSSHWLSVRASSILYRYAHSLTNPNWRQDRHIHYLLQARSVWDCPLCCFECITSCSQTRKNVVFCFFLVCALLDRHGNRPRANHEEQGWSTAGGDRQEIFRLHPREWLFWLMISVCKLNYLIKLYLRGVVCMFCNDWRTSNSWGYNERSMLRGKKTWLFSQCQHISSNLVSRLDLSDSR